MPSMEWSMLVVLPKKVVPLLLFFLCGFNALFSLSRLQQFSSWGNEQTASVPEANEVEATPQPTVATVATKGPAIAYLVPNICDDLKELLYSISSVDKHLKDEMKTPLLIFNEGDLGDEQKRFITDSTNRTVHFPVVDFNEYPAGFDPVKEQPSVFAKRTKWGYPQMCRFWATKIWEHPILDDYSHYMRFDTDSCLTQDQNLTSHGYLPGLPTDGNETYVYGVHRFSNEPPDYITGLFDTAYNYTMTNKIKMKNANLFKAIANGRIVYNNYEISDISFFRQPEVMRFQRAMTEEEPFGVFRSRWGDAPIRTLTLAIFAEKSQVLWDARMDGYQHTCRKGPRGRTGNPENIRSSDMHFPGCSADADEASAARIL